MNIIKRMRAAFTSVLFLACLAALTFFAPAQAEAVDLHSAKDLMARYAMEKKGIELSGVWSKDSKIRKEIAAEIGFGKRVYTGSSLDNRTVVSLLSDLFAAEAVELQEKQQKPTLAVALPAAIPTPTPKTAMEITVSKQEKSDTEVPVQPSISSSVQHSRPATATHLILRSFERDFDMKVDDPANVIPANFQQTSSEINFAASPVTPTNPVPKVPEKKIISTNSHQNDVAYLIIPPVLILTILGLLGLLVSLLPWLRRWLSTQTASSASKARRQIPEPRVVIVPQSSLLYRPKTVLPPRKLRTQPVYRDVNLELPALLSSNSKGVHCPTTPKILKDRRVRSLRFRSSKLAAV